MNPLLRGAIDVAPCHPLILRVIPRGARSSSRAEMVHAAVKPAAEPFEPDPGRAGVGTEPPHPRPSEPRLPGQPSSGEGVHMPDSSSPTGPTMPADARISTGPLPASVMDNATWTAPVNQPALPNGPLGNASTLGGVAS